MNVCQRTHVQNHAYANKSRRTWVRHVHQLSNPKISHKLLKTFVLLILVYCTIFRIDLYQLHFTKLISISGTWWKNLPQQKLGAYYQLACGLRRESSLCLLCVTDTTISFLFHLFIPGPSVPKRTGF